MKKRPHQTNQSVRPSDGQWRIDGDSLEFDFPLFPPYTDGLRLLAESRFSDNPAKQEAFQKNAPRSVRLLPGEFGKLVQHGLRLRKLERIDEIDRRCGEIAANVDDPRREFIDEIMSQVSVLRGRLRRGLDADCGHLEYLCSQANLVYLRPLADRGLTWRGGRRPGARDALGRALLEILRGDPRKPSREVLEALKKKPIVQAVVPHRDPRKGLVIRWQNPANGKVHRTSWLSIRDSRLPGLRRQAKDQSAAP